MQIKYVQHDLICLNCMLLILGLFCAIANNVYPGCGVKHCEEKQILLTVSDVIPNLKCARHGLLV